MMLTTVLNVAPYTAHFNAEFNVEFNAEFNAEFDAEFNARFSKINVQILLLNSPQISHFSLRPFSLNSNS
jgi:hypothetical protein